MKMKKIPILLFALMAISLGIQAKKIPVHAWLSGPVKAIH
jgi:NADH:ubiquinone oxidoreductase subunit 4 (subunit M)